MKITFLIGSFPPEISNSRLGFQLCKSFLKSGHNVTVVTSFPRKYLVRDKVARRARFHYREVVDGLNVIRMGPEFSNRDNVRMRGFEYFFQFFSFFVGGLLSGRPDVIVVCSPPLTLALASIFLSRIRPAPVVVRIGDLHPQELVDLGMIKSRLLILLLELMELFVYRKSDSLTVLSNGYRKHLLGKGAESSRTIVLPNWGDVDEIAGIDGSDALPDCQGKFVVTYAGIMSWFQDLETIVDAAIILREHTDIHFLFVGDGVQKKPLQEKCKQLKMLNLTFMPLQPRHEYLKILKSSSVCVVSIKKELKTTTIPSKLLDIMGCGRPVIANVPFGEVSDIVSESESGVWVDAGNPEKFAQAILELQKNPAETTRLGRNARDYLEKNFTLKACAQEYERIFQKLTQDRANGRVLSGFSESNPKEPIDSLQRPSNSY